MKKLYSPLFPCNQKIENKELEVEKLKKENIELVRFNEGWGCFDKNEWYWISEKEKLELVSINKDVKIFEGPYFESNSWYSLTPIELEIEVTRNCNLHCIHCWNESGPSSI